MDDSCFYDTENKSYSLLFQSGFPDSEMNCAEDCSLPKETSPIIPHPEYRYILHKYIYSIYLHKYIYIQYKTVSSSKVHKWLLNSNLSTHDMFAYRQTPVHIKEEDIGSNLLMGKNGLARLIKQEMEQNVDQNDTRDDASPGTGHDEDMLDHFDESDGEERASIPFDDSEKTREV